MSTQPFRPEPDRPVTADPTTCFSLQAAADPGLMPRIVEIFARRGLVPTRLHASVGGPRNDLSIDLEMAGMAPRDADRIAVEMRALWGVDLVLTTQKRGA
jgi:acetolactate synthase regulatory subunit